MSLTLGNGDALDAKQDVGTDIVLTITGDDRTVSGSVDAYKVLVAQTITASQANYLAPAAGHDYIVSSIKITNPGASTRIVTLYLDNVNPAVVQWGAPITLAPGCSAEWGGDEWNLYNATGNVVLTWVTSTVAAAAVTVAAGTAGTSSHLPSSDDHTHQGVPVTLYSAKGAVLGASGANVPVAKLVSANGGLLIANSADASGIDYLVLTTLGDYIRGATGAIPTRQAASAATPAKIGGASAGTAANPPSADDHGHALSLAAGKVANTSINDTTTPTTGGVTFAAPAIAAGHIYRIRAHGQFTAVSSVTTRNSQVSPFWGSTAMPTLAAIVVVPPSLAQTTQWELEFILVGVDTTHIWVTGYFHSRLGLAAADTQAQRLATMTNVAPASTLVTSGAQTLDLRFSMSTAVATDIWVIQQVTMERLA